MDLDVIVYGDYTLKEVLIFAGIAFIALLILWSVVKKLFKKKEANIHVQRVRCPGCGWQGQVSRYAGRCPGCNEPLGDQSAKSG